MSNHDIESHIKVYWNVFFALLAFTGLTVGVTYIEFGSVFWTFFVGLAIACVKGYLVAAYFMHLNNERKSIYYLLILSVVSLFVLMSIPMIWRSSAASQHADNPPYVSQDSYVKYKEVKHHDKGGH